MTDIETRLRHELIREAERVQPESLRSLRPPLAGLPAARGPAGRSSADRSSAQAAAGRRWPAAARYRRFRTGRRRRVLLLRLALASAGAAAAVAALAGLGGLGGSGRSAEGSASIRDELRGAPAPLPRFYVALVGQGPAERAVVHDSVSGQVLSSAPVPAAIRGAARFHLHVAADGDDRTFAVVAQSGVGHHHPALRVLILRVSADGSTPGLRLLPGRFAVADPAARVTGVALSADGTSLAAALVAAAPRRAAHAFVETVSLTTGTVRTWAAVNEAAADPSWVKGRYVGFVAEPRRRPSTSGGHPARTQIRLLDTAGAGRRLLTSAVLATSGKSLGSISSALVSPDGRTILATTYRNVPGLHGQGHAVDQLVSLSAATGRVTGRLQTAIVGYRGARQGGAEQGGAQQMRAADFSCQVLSLAGTAGIGQALVQCPRLARLSGGRLIKLPPAAPSTAFPAGLPAAASAVVGW
jgi:hypothetical protein